MFHQKTGLFLQSAITALLFCLFFTHCCRGQSQVIGPSQPIVATLGDDIILPCYLEPAYDAMTVTVEWARPDLNPRFIYVSRLGQELEKMKNPAYKERTSMFIDELKHGNISLKISKVKPADAGRYRCFTIELNKDTFISLVVVSGAVPQPVITLTGVDGKGGVELQCESAGWYPEPEVLWLDGDGNLLSAGPTETVRGPEDLYTVSSRVTVEKKHSNKFTCRVQQNNINQSREAVIQVTDDFFKVQSGNTLTIVGLAVCLVVSIILLIVAVVLFVRTRRQKRKRKTLVNEQQEELELWTEAEGKLRTVIQKMIQELDEMDSQFQQQRHENITVENQLEEWMETGRKLKIEIQNKIQELEEIIGTNSASGKSMTAPITVEEVHKRGLYICLKNISSEEINLGGWKLELQKNNNKPAAYTFKKSLKLQAGKSLSIRQSNWYRKNPDAVDLVWSDMMSWMPEDKLQMNLISNDGQIFKLR